MANTLTDLVPVMYEALDVVSRERTGMIAAVARNAKAETAAVGQVVKVPVTQEQDAADIVPGVTPPNTGDQTVDSVDITITKSRAVPIKWNGEEMMGTAELESIMRDQFSQAYRTLSAEVQADLIAQAKIGASRAVGTAGTTPFATIDDLSDFANVTKELDDNGAPAGLRGLVLNSAAVGNMRSKQPGLTRVNESGSSAGLRQGALLDVFNLEIFNAGRVASHTAGTGTGYAINGTPAEKDILLPVDTGSGTILAGDVVEIDGVKYVVNADYTATNISINKPGATTAHADGAAVTLGASYTPNFAFTQNAIQLATRAPAMPSGGDAASDVVLVLDSESGLVFQVALYQMYRQIKIEVGLAWGVSVIKPNHLITLLG